MVSQVLPTSSLVIRGDIFPDERFNLNVKTHSSLSKGIGIGGTVGTDAGQAQQTTYSVHGKHVVFNFMSTVEGTVITPGETSAGTTGKTGTTGGSTGAHLGLLAKWVRGDGQPGGIDFVRSVTLDCTADEASSTPNTWTCDSRNEFNVYLVLSSLPRLVRQQTKLAVPLKTANKAEL